MTRYLLRVRLAAERDPATSPGLLTHLSRPTARGHGVEILSEAVVDGERSVYLIVDAADEGAVHAYAAPLAEVGNVEVLPATTWAAAAARGVAPPRAGEAAEYDAGEVSRQAVAQGLVVLRANPLNCETPLAEIAGGSVVPSSRFYVRNHFPIPRLEMDTWRLRVGGLVERPLELGLADLMAMPTHSVTAALECAGNGRTLFEPVPEGERWRLGAVSSAEWTGVPLAAVLERAGLDAAAREIVFRGADRGTLPGQTAAIRYERSLAPAVAGDPDVLLAYAMNGEPLPIEHGAPLRLVVPRWYAVASVKWLTEIEAVAEPFEGHFQTGSYFFEREQNGHVAREPLSLMRVRSLITRPAPEATLPRGEVAIRGVAWSGAAPIARVEVEIDGEWREARLLDPETRYGWRPWEALVRLERPGEVVLRARATDQTGATQPERAEWNRLGYCNNAIHRVVFRVS